MHRLFFFFKDHWVKRTNERTDERTYECARRFFWEKRSLKRLISNWKLRRSTFIMLTSVVHVPHVISTAVKRRARAQWVDIMAANYREIQNTFSKSQKIKQFLERKALNVEHLWENSCLFTILWLYRLVLCFVTVFLAKLSYELRFELIQIFKALTTGCDVGFCVWPLWTCDILTQEIQVQETLPVILAEGGHGDDLGKSSGPFWWQNIISVKPLLVSMPQLHNGNYSHDTTLYWLK